MQLEILAIGASILALGGVVLGTNVAKRAPKAANLAIATDVSAFWLK